MPVAPEEPLPAPPDPLTAGRKQRTSAAKVGSRAPEPVSATGRPESLPAASVHLGQPRVGSPEGRPWSKLGSLLKSPPMWAAQTKALAEMGLRLHSGARTLGRPHRAVQELAAWRGKSREGLTAGHVIRGFCQQSQCPWVPHLTPAG